ncbi:MAG TPA: YggS family pyridoxal phosphate enzyme [Gaiellaceae bacterium]
MQSPDEIRARLAQVQATVGDRVTVVAATKYVSLADMATLVEAGVKVVGENRAQDLEAKHAEYGDAFEWHFIGHLQSNKVNVVNRICTLAHSLDSPSAAKKLTIPALLQINLAGEASKSGVDPSEIGGYEVVGLSTMPPAAVDPEQSRPWFARLAGLAAEHGLQELSMGTTQDFAVAAEEGATYVRVGSVLFAG